LAKPSRGMPQPPEYGARPGPSVEQVQMQVQGVRGIMQENVDVMLANIDKTEVLEDKSSALASQAKSFQKTSRAVKKKMWCANMKMNLLIGCVCIIIVLAIVIPVVTSAGWSARILPLLETRVCAMVAVWTHLPCCSVFCGVAGG
uniref:V-SNARE coiled-coil homology domain-containing protein n=1 Tax=Seriola lalandi dorsalis TaxID=1841481 RepID=A0A3B4X3J1_SERLL